MSGPGTWHTLTRTAWLLLGSMVVLGATGCQNDAWRFAESDVFTNQPTIESRAEARTVAHWGDSPVVRGQYSADAGRSVPSLTPSTTTYPSTSSTSYPSSSTPTYPSSTTSNTSAPTTPQSAPTSPPYANQFPTLGPPPLTGDAGGQGPYMPNRGVLDDLDPIGNDPAWDEPTRFIPLSPMLQETQTGRMMFGVGVNSDAGLVGSIVLDEQNFDWTRFPRSWEDIRNATAWRGAGQRFRIEAVPGTEYQKYMVNFQEPYFLNSEVSFGLSGHYYTRQYTEWDEERIGGRVALGYHFTHALTGSIAYRGMRVNLFDLIEPAPAELTDAEGKSSLHGFEAKLAHDTRDSSFLPTEGHLIEASIEQVVGTYSYPRARLDLRKYFMMHERPDGSGRHVLSLNTRVGYTGDDTPIYEHFFAGGFSTIRGFDFRGASPIDPATGVRVGGEFQLLASAEYLFPITADDMLRGVVFCDTGTVERKIGDWEDKYRVAPGFGLRIAVPAMGPAPIALDFAFPVVDNPGDETEVFSFFVGFMR